MNGDSVVALIATVTMAVLVGSSLLARRLPIGPMVKMAAAWVAIFAVAYAAFLYRGEAGDVWQRMVADVRGEGDMRISGQTLHIRKSDDGHFWLTARVNNTRARFLIDSGATVTTISTATARAAGIAGERAAVPVSTANGIVVMQRGRITTLIAGPIEQRDAPVNISAVDDTNVLGMSFLSRVRRWQVEGDTLTIDS